MAASMMVSGHKRKLSDPTDAERFDATARPVRTTQLGLVGYMGSALRYATQIFAGTRQLLNVLVVPVAGAHKKRILGPEAQLSIPGAWKPEFDDCHNATLDSSPKRRNAPAQAPSSPPKPVSTLPFPTLPPPKSSPRPIKSLSTSENQSSKSAATLPFPTSKPISPPIDTPKVPPPPFSKLSPPNRVAPPTPGRDVWLDIVSPAPTRFAHRFQQPKPMKPVVLPAKRLFRRMNFLSSKKAQDITEVSTNNATAGKLLLAPRPKQIDHQNQRILPYQRKLLQRARDERPVQQPPTPKPLFKSTLRPSARKTSATKVEEPRTPASKINIQNRVAPSPLDASMIDAPAPQPSPAPPQVLRSPQDVEMTEAPPVRRIHFMPDSVLTGSPIHKPAKVFYKELAINELPKDLNTYRENSPEYDMDNSGLYDTPPDRFAASRNLSPANPSSSSSDEEDETVAELRAIINEWHAELTNSPIEKPSQNYYSWLDRRVEEKKKQEAARAAKEEHARKQEEARKLKIQQEAQKAREEERKRKAAEAAKKKAEEERARKAKEEEERKAREALEAAQIIKPLSEPWKKKVMDTMAVAVMTQDVIVSPIGNMSRRDLGTLLPQPGTADDQSGWLNDEIVNRYLKLITGRAREKEGWNNSGPAPYAAFLSHWMTTMTTKGPGGVTRWGRREKLQGANILKAKYIFIPICISSHWRLIAISPFNRTIEYLDSMYSFEHGPAKEHVAKVKKWLSFELKDAYNEAEWTVVSGRSGRQSNGSDCGVFASMNAFALIRGLEPDFAVTAQDMPAARMQMAATLLNQACTGEFDWE